MSNRNKSYGQMILKHLAQQGIPLRMVAERLGSDEHVFLLTCLGGLTINQDRKIWGVIDKIESELNPLF